MDIVIPVRRSEFNGELRFMLRSISANVPHRRIWIAGFKPSWVTNISYIPTKQGPTKYLASTANLRAAASHPDVSEEFVFANDDTFVMEPVNEIGVFHRGYVADVEAAYAARGIRSGYMRGMRETRYLLAQHGILTPLSYELHVPMPMNKAQVLEALDAGRDLKVLHKRTLYANLARLGGTQMSDVKVSRLDGRFPRDSLFLSTTETSFSRGAVGRHIRARFPQPGPYEIPPPRMRTAPTPRKALR